MCKEFCKSNRTSGLPWWLSGEESACQCRGHGFDPWVGELRFCILCKSQNQDYLQIICNMNYAKIKCIYLMILGNF